MDDTQRFEVKLDEKGNLIINPYEYLKNLSDEQKKEFIDDGGWWCLIEEEIVNSIINSFSTENYNESYHRFRKLLLNSDAMPEVIRNWAKTMIELRFKSKQQEGYWQQAYHELSKWANNLWEKNGTGRWVDAGFPKLPERNYSVAYPKEIIEDAYKKAEEWGILFPDPDDKEKDLK